MVDGYTIFVRYVEQSPMRVCVYVCGRVNFVLCNGAVICKELVTRDNENAFETYGRLKICRCIVVAVTVAVAVRCLLLLASLFFLFF